MIYQLELATLIRVQNLSLTATDFRKKIAHMGSAQHHPK
jgi:hypothetical protein